MAVTASSDIDLLLKWLHQDTQDFSTLNDNSQIRHKKSFTAGTAAGQIDEIWRDQRTVINGANDDLDLTALQTTRLGGTTTVNFARIKLIYIENLATNVARVLTVGSGPQTFVGPFGGTAHTVSVPAESPLILVNRGDGWTVTNASADTLRIANSSGDSITYNILLLGIKT